MNIDAPIKTHSQPGLNMQEIYTLRCSECKEAIEYYKTDFDEYVINSGVSPTESNMYQLFEAFCHERVKIHYNKYHEEVLAMKVLADSSGWNDLFTLKIHYGTPAP